MRWQLVARVGTVHSTSRCSREMAGARVKCLLPSGSRAWGPTHRTRAQPNGQGSRQRTRPDLDTLPRHECLAAVATAICLGRIWCSKIRCAAVSIWLGAVSRVSDAQLRRRRAWRSGAVGGEPACSQQRLVQAKVLPGLQCGCVGRLPGWTQRRVACPGPAALSCHR